MGRRFRTRPNRTLMTMLPVQPESVRNTLPFTQKARASSRKPRPLWTMERIFADRHGDCLTVIQVSDKPY